MDDENKTKRNLQDYLIENGIDIKDCAKDTGLSLSLLYKIWNNKQKPGYKSRKILDAYTNNQITWKK